MQLLTTQNLTVEKNGRTLVRSLDLELTAGKRLGLVGANGSGKSTLLRVLAGLETATAGRVRRAPGIRTAYLEQAPRWNERQTAWQAAKAGLARVAELEMELREAEQLLGSRQGSLRHGWSKQGSSKHGSSEPGSSEPGSSEQGSSDNGVSEHAVSEDSEMKRYADLYESFERAGGYGAEVALRETLTRLGLSQERLELPVGELSGGERARLALARTLASGTEVLLLDEPSNHLDLAAVSWLAGRLSRFDGAIVLVSHDRALLDEICTHTAEIREETVAVTRGGISRLREQQGMRRRNSEKQRRERRKEIERLERTAAELRAWGTAKAQKRRKRVERDLTRVDSPPEVEPRTSTAPLEAREASGVLLEARYLRKEIDDRPLIACEEVIIRAGEKIALLGPNGSGKSTLLDLLAGAAASDDPRVEFRLHRDLKLLHADQQGRGLSDGVPLLQQLEQLVSTQRAHLLSSLCGLDEEHREVEPEALSGGERARAGLARLLAAEANLLLLDEPTNDLDLEAIETLHQALADTEAAVVLATHDRALASLAERVWAIEGSELVEYRGGLEGYLAGCRRVEPEAVEIVNRQHDGAEGTDTGRQEHDGDASTVQLERLELERLGIEARLDDPLLLGEREKVRLERRLAEIFDDLSLHYDQSLPRPAPTFSLHEVGVRVAADIGPEGLSFENDGPVDLRLLVLNEVGHITLREHEGHALLPWARAALLDGAVRLAFYALAPAAIQYQWRGPLNTRLLQGGRDGWWSLSRKRFEELEGWRGARPTEVSSIRHSRR